MSTLRNLPESLSRGQQKAQTETRILDAAGRLLEEGRLDEANFAEIARMAGVSWSPMAMNSTASCSTPAGWPLSATGPTGRF